MSEDAFGPRVNMAHHARRDANDGDAPACHLDRSSLHALHDVDCKVSSYTRTLGSTSDARKQYSNACRACSVNRSNSSMTIMMARGDGFVKRANRCDGRVVGAYSYLVSLLHRQPSVTPTASSAVSSSSSSAKFIPSASAICRPISRIAKRSFVCASPDNLTTIGLLVELDGSSLSARAIV